jgi:hypothetical protein
MLASNERPIGRAPNRLAQLRKELVEKAPNHPALARVLKREISLAEVHVRVLRRLKAPGRSLWATHIGASTSRVLKRW